MIKQCAFKISASNCKAQAVELDSGLVSTVGGADEDPGNRPPERKILLKISLNKKKQPEHIYIYTSLTSKVGTKSCPNKKPH